MTNKPNQTQSKRHQDTKTAQTTETEAAVKRPYKEVWVVEDRPNARSRWTRVGVAFENRDGSWNLKLSAVPIGLGQLNIRDPREEERQVAA